jgi:hypothetical protein
MKLNNKMENCNKMIISKIKISINQIKVKIKIKNDIK